MGAERRRRRATIRLRATAAVTLIVAAALVVAGLTLMALVRHSLVGGVDTALQARATDLATLVEDGVLPNPVTVSGDEDALVQVVAADGTVVAASANIEGQPRISLLAPAPGTAAVGTVSTLPIDQRPFRFVARSVRAGGEVYTVYVAANLEDVDAQTARLGAALAIGIPVLVVIVAFTAWLVIGRTLRPVESIRSEVEAITASQLHRRVPEPAVDDEVGRLARTMNRMLGRLESAAEAQRAFVADASHELRSPLTGIRAQLEVDLAHGDGVSRERTEREALGEVVRLQRMVDDLLILARGDEPAVERAREPVDLDDLVLREIDRLRTRGRIAVDATGLSAGQVKADREALARAVRNLLDNAERHAGSCVWIGLSEEGDTVTLTVEDDGPGIPEEQRSRVFERFARVDAARGRGEGGTGLGLAIARQIVELHGGEITLGGSAHGGARFIVRLPAELS
jgi:signal transduction histidine kinase